MRSHAPWHSPENSQSRIGRRSRRQQNAAHTAGFEAWGRLLAPRGVGRALGLVGVELVWQPGHSICKPLQTDCCVPTRWVTEHFNCLFFYVHFGFRIGFLLLSSLVSHATFWELFLCATAWTLPLSIGRNASEAIVRLLRHESLWRTLARACAERDLLLSDSITLYSGLIGNYSWKNCSTGERNTPTAK